MASFEKIDYFLRPSKQVERKLIIEALQKLSKAGHFIHEYTYLGLGSVFYVDFLLFHKYLHIDSMICAEIEDCPDRMDFNKPYEFIDLQMRPVGDVIPEINREKPHFVWLDYDFTIDQDVLADLRKCLHVLAPGSVLLLTVASDLFNLTNLIDDIDKRDLTENQQKQEVVKRLNELIGDHYGSEIKIKDIAASRLPTLMATAIRNYINSCMAIRPDVEFIQLFNFHYKDNMNMLTLGGILGDPQTHKSLEDTGLFKLKFVTESATPVEISVPPLTIRERNWLEKHLTQLEQHLAASPHLPNDMPFEIKAQLVKNFVKYYRHYPFYFETLV